jgi:hypothetical protein
MLKKFVTLALAGALVCAQGGARAAAQAEKDSQTLAGVKAKIARAGTGETARVTVRLKDGTTRKGYVSEAREAEFVLRDLKTDAPTVIPYADAARVEINRPHSTVRKYVLGTVATLGALFLISVIVVAAESN